MFPNPNENILDVFELLTARNKPISSESEYKYALEILSKLMNMTKEEDSLEFKILNTLADKIVDYEEIHYPIDIEKYNYAVNSLKLNKGE